MSRIRTCLLLVALALAGGCDLVKPRATKAPVDPDPFGPLAWVISPTQGRPALLKVGGRLPVAFRVPADFSGRVEFRLTDAIVPDRSNGSVPLTLERELTIAPQPAPAPGSESQNVESLASGVVKVPDYADAGLYDLTIRLLEDRRPAPLRAKVMPRSVALFADFPASFRFVQLSNMNVGDETAPDFSDALVEDVNRVAPAFIITTGDYTAWSSARDDAESWRRIKHYFARFEAPVFLVAGDLDHEASFQQYVAESRSGQFFFGPCHGILLYDNYRNPIDRDTTQALWLDSIIREAPNVSFRFLVSSNDSLRVFDAWRKLGYAPADYVQRSRIGMVFVGGYNDWDFVEHAAKRGNAAVHYVRTHASSTCIRSKATGVPHFRLVQVDQPPASALAETPAAGPTRVMFAVPENGSVQRAQHSVPVGQLKVFLDGPDDGSADKLRVTVLNRLTIPIPQLRVKVRLKRSAGQPVAIGGQIERVLDRGGAREVWLRIDCPDLGTASAVVGPASSLPPVSDDIQFRFLGDPRLVYRPARTPDGFAYFATDGQFQLQMTNQSSSPRQLWPVVRLNGNLLSLKGTPPEHPVTLAAGEQRTLPVTTPLGLASPGEHWLTVHLADDALPTITRRTVELFVLDGEAATSRNDE